MLHRIRYIEAWGRGVPLILEKAPDAEFKEFGSLFIARFKREELEGASPENTTETSLKTGPKTGLETGSVTGSEMPEQHQQAILQYLANEPTATISRLAVVTGLSINGVKYHLKKLREADRLVRHGANKGGYWEVL